jgi:hypothetical protein
LISQTVQIQNESSDGVNKDKDNSSYKKSASISKISDKRSLDHYYSNHSNFIHLEQTVGNQAIQKLVRSDIIQPKLKVSHPNDVYEQEADRVAEQVMRMSLRSEDIAPVNAINEEKIDRKCQSCQDDEEKEKEMIQRKTTDNNQYEIPLDVAQSISSIRGGGGSPLDSSTRAFMEPRFGFDFSNVKIHNDGKAARSAKALGAHAYTLGTDIVFDSSQYIQIHIREDKY